MVRQVTQNGKIQLPEVLTISIRKFLIPTFAVPQSSETSEDLANYFPSSARH